MGAVLALMSSLLWGSADFLGGLTSRRLPPAMVYGASQAVGLLVLAVVATATGAWALDGAAWGWGLVSGLLGLVSMLAFYSALSIGPMGIIAPLVSVSAVVPVVAGIARGEAPAAGQVAGIAVAIVGIALASGPELTGAESARPLVLAGVAAVGFGGMYVTMAFGSEHQPLLLTIGMRVVSVVVLGVAALLLRPDRRPQRRDAAPIASIGVLDAGANLSYGVATTMGLLATTSVLASLYPVVTAVLAGVVLHERLRRVQYVGVAATVIGVALIAAS